MLWEWRYGTVHSDGLTAIAYDHDSGILYACGYTAGDFSEPLDADPVPDAKAQDAVVLALDTSTRELLWLKSFSSGPDVDRADEALAITFDRSGVLHVSGRTRGKGALSFFLLRSPRSLWLLIVPASGLTEDVSPREKNRAVELDLGSYFPVYYGCYRRCS